MIWLRVRVSLRNKVKVRRARRREAFDLVSVSGFLRYKAIVDGSNRYTRDWVCGLSIARGARARARVCVCVCVCVGRYAWFG